MIRSIRFVLLLLIVNLGIGCAAIFSSGPEPVELVSDPEGAEILLNGEKMGTTPLTLQLHAEKQHIVTFRRRGYEDATISLTTHVRPGWVVLDILAGVVGVAIDAATGEWKTFDSGRHFIELKSQE
jgi:hypothetical protein